RRRCDAEHEARCLDEMRRPRRHPDESGGSKREDEEPDREAGDEAEAHEEPGQQPRAEPLPAPAARHAAVPPGKDSGGDDEKRPCEDHQASAIGRPTTSASRKRGSSSRYFASARTPTPSSVFEKKHRAAAARTTSMISVSESPR